MRDNTLLVQEDGSRKVQQHNKLHKVAEGRLPAKLEGDDNVTSTTTMLILPENFKGLISPSIVA